MNTPAVPRASLGSVKIGRRPLVSAAAIAGAAALAAGCGSGGSKSETTSTETWASGVCSAVTDYQNAITSATSSLKGGNLSQATIEKAVKSMKGATDDFAQALKGLGKPDTQAAATAKQTLDTLSSQLQADAQSVDKATSGDAALMTSIATVGTTLATAKTQVSAAFSQLKTADAKGELTDAFKKAPSCDSFAGL
jgi:hypothetical protein